MTPGQKREVAIYLRVHNKLTAGLRQAESQLGGFRRKMGQAFVAAAAVATAAIGTITTAAVNIGSAFEQGLANVGSMSSSVGAAYAAELDQLEARARSLGETTAFTAREVTDAMYTLASGGMTVAQNVASAEGVLKLAGATLSGMGQAAEITMSTMRQFGLEATDTARIVNVFGAGIRNSMLNMDRLTYSMSFAGPMAASVGMKVEETTAALALLHNGGLLASRAGTGLRMMFTRLLKPTEQLTNLLGGVSLANDGFRATLEALSESGISATQMVENFGARAYNAIAILAAGGVDAFDKMTDAVTGTNSAWEMYDKQMDTVRAQWKIVKSAYEENMIAVFKVLRPVLMDALYAMQDFVRGSKQRLIDLATAMVDAVGKIYGKLEGLLNFIRDNWTTIKTMATYLGYTTAAVYALATAVGILNAAMKIGKWQIIITALVALAGYLGAIEGKSKAVSTAWAEASAWAQRAIVNAEAWLNKTWNNVAAIGLKIKVVTTNIFHAFEPVWAWFGRLFSNLRQAWISFVHWLTGIAEKVNTVLNAVGKFFGKDMEKNLTPGTGFSLNNLMTMWGGMGGSLKQAFIDAFGRGTDEIDQLLMDNNAGWEAWRERRIAKINAERDARLRLIAAELAARANRPDHPSSSRGTPTENEVVTMFGWWTQMQESAFLMMEELEKKAGVDLPKAGNKGFVDLESSAKSAASGITQAFTAAVFRVQDLMSGLASVGMSIFGSLLGGIINYGLGNWTSFGGFLQKAFAPDRVAPVANAMGGAFSAGERMLVGERGPELVSFGRAGMVTPNNELVGGGGGVTVNLTVTPGSLIVADDSMAVRRLTETISRGISDELKRPTHKE